MIQVCKAIVNEVIKVPQLSLLSIIYRFSFCSFPSVIPYPNRKMDSLPPNDPNNNRNNNNNRLPAKEVPRPGPRRDDQLNENGEMEVFGGGNLGDQGAILALFLMGVASWILRERCIC